jgi:hypothetical protein
MGTPTSVLSVCSLPQLSPLRSVAAAPHVISFAYRIEPAAPVNTRISSRR